MKDSYHHGNLKHDLLEASIRVISQNGFDALSLRGVAAACGVSHNAAYRHFANKQQLISACREYVTERMMAHLNAAIAGTGPTCADALRRLSAAYISFYQQYPTYYSALYRNTAVNLAFSSEKTEDNYPPLNLFRSACFAYGAEKGWTVEETLTNLIRLWSLVHGLTALVISDSVVWNRDWQKCLDDIME